MLPFWLHKLDNAHNIRILLFIDMVSFYSGFQVIFYIFNKHYRQVDIQADRQRDACIRLGESGTDDKEYVYTRLQDLSP